MDATLARLVRETCFDFDEVAEGLKAADVDFGLVKRESVDADACRRRWSDLDVDSWAPPENAMVGVRDGLEGMSGVYVRAGDGPGETFTGTRIPTFEDLQRKAAALPQRFNVPLASLPSVGDVDDDDDDDDGAPVAIFSRRTDFESLDD